MKRDIIDKIKNKIPPWVFLLFAAPFIGELLSAHQTPLQFFNPLSFLIMALPYGFGAIICRELTVRWKKGWLSFFLLSVAYGIYEEGIVVRSFFNPNWSELGATSIYNFLGISWTFSFVLVYFHVIISIWCSVKLAELIYYKKKKERWTSNKKLYFIMFGLLLWLPAGWLMTSYVPPLMHYVAIIVIFIGLILLAKFLPNKKIKTKVRKKVPSPIIFYLIGAFSLSFVFVSIFILPEMGVVFPLWAVMLFLIVLNIVTFFMLKSFSGNFRSWSDLHQLALLAGFLTFVFFTSVLSEFEEISGSSVVVVLFIAFLSLKEYTFTDKINWFIGSEFSINAIDPQAVKIDLRNDTIKFDVPVYILQGIHDMQCPLPLVEEYFEMIEAPDKELFLFNESAHSPLFEEPNKTFEIIREILQRDI